MALGDHLYYYRAGGTYSHHGIDCGGGTVIHYETLLWMKLVGMVASAKPPRVTRSSMAEFSRGSEVLIRSYDDVSRVDDADTSIKRAESRIGEECYDVFGNNCEHFIVWCKTGVAESSQVNAHRRAADVVIKGVPVGAFLLKAARRGPDCYRRVVTLGAVAVAGAVYLSTYFHQRTKDKDAGLS